MTTAQTFRTDTDLFGLARDVLTQAGFAHEEVRLPEGQLLLSENEYSILALAATPTLGELVSAESRVATFLQDRLHGTDIGPKVWDAYVVLLTQEVQSVYGAGLHPLFRIAYDTRGSRRIARAGIALTPWGVRTALSPFLPPLQLKDAGLATAPLVALSAALLTHGLDKETATRAVDVYRRGGHLDDVF